MNLNISKDNATKVDNFNGTQEELDEDLAIMLEKLLTDGKDVNEGEIGSLSTMSTINNFGEVALPESWAYFSESDRSRVFTLQDKNNDFINDNDIKVNISSQSDSSLKEKILDVQQLPTFLRNYKNFIDINNISNSIIQYQKVSPFIDNPKNHLSIKEFYRDFISEDLYRSLKGKFKDLVKNFNGSKLIQNCLLKTKSEIITKIFQEIIPNIDELIIHKYGNYFCQKIYNLLNYEDKIKFLLMLTKNFLQISADKIGNYSLQTIIENLQTDQEKLIIIEALQFRNTLEYMTLERNSVHVLEKIISCFKEEQINFIYEFIINNFLALSNNQFGLCIVKKAIIHATSYLTLRRIQLILIHNFQYLIQNMYGNYTIQIAIEYWNNLLIFPILKLFINNFLKLSISKFSSNVVEKCFEKGGQEIVNIFVDEIIYSKKIHQLIKSNYGNYVLHKALLIASPDAKIALIKNIMENLRKIEDKNLIIKWKHICGTNIEFYLRFQSLNVNHNNDIKLYNNINNYSTQNYPS